MAANRTGGSGQIVRWEVLPGLPGEGPVALHFHTGHRTPWAEGTVIRFWSEDGTNWVGNFKGRQDRNAKVLVWPEADAIVVQAMDNLYLVDARSPESYTSVPSPEFALVEHLMFDAERRMLFVAANTTIYAYGQDRRLAWTLRISNGYDALLLECVDDVLTVDVEEELGGARRTMKLSTQDGSVL